MDNISPIIPSASSSVEQLHPLAKPFRESTLSTKLKWNMLLQQPQKTARASSTASDTNKTITVQPDGSRASSKKSSMDSTSSSAVSTSSSSTAMESLKSSFGPEWKAVGQVHLAGELDKQSPRPYQGHSRERAISLLERVSSSHLVRSPDSADSFKIDGPYSAREPFSSFNFAPYPQSNACYNDEQHAIAMNQRISTPDIGQHNGHQFYAPQPSPSHIQESLRRQSLLTDGPMSQDFYPLMHQQQHQYPAHHRPNNMPRLNYHQQLLHQQRRSMASVASIDPHSHRRASTQQRYMNNPDNDPYNLEYEMSVMNVDDLNSYRQNHNQYRRYHHFEHHQQYHYHSNSQQKYPLYPQSTSHYHHLHYLSQQQQYPPSPPPSLYLANTCVSSPSTTPLSSISSSDLNSMNGNASDNANGDNALSKRQRHSGSLFVVEFKAGRIEVFYVVESAEGFPSIIVSPGDLVIVEADRGEDLGRIKRPISIERLKQLVSRSNSADDNASDDANAGEIEPELTPLLSSKEIVPKRIYRIATPSDLKLLHAKAQEEAIAMVRCQSRVAQRHLPMEVVDAEYQWDRNKLTFYFAAETRIDFRELVRDLFRIYKTRIWMCAVDKHRTAALEELQHTGLLSLEQQQDSQSSDQCSVSDGKSLEWIE